MVSQELEGSRSDVLAGEEDPGMHTERLCRSVHTQDDQDRSPVCEEVQHHWLLLQC